MFTWLYFIFNKALPQRIRLQTQMVIVLDVSVPDRQESDPCDTFLWTQLTFHLSTMMMWRYNEPGSMSCTPLSMTDSFLLVQYFSARGTLITGEHKKWQVMMKIWEKPFLQFFFLKYRWNSEYIAKGNKTSVWKRYLSALWSSL